MDENYLDNLLNEFSLDKEIDHKIEDELDEEISTEKRRRRKENAVSREESFNMDLEYDANAIDSDVDIDFSEAQIDELDRLDNLADIDIGDMDFSDIDFDDIDITKLGDELSDNFDDLLSDFEGDLEIPDFDDVDHEQNSYESENDDEESGEFSESSEDEQFPDGEISDSQTDEAYTDEDLSIRDNDDFEQAASNPENDNQSSEDLNVDSFDADSFLDSLLDESDEIEGTDNSGYDTSKADNIPDADMADDNSTSDDETQDSLDSLLDGDEQSSDSDVMEALSDDDDLFSMLNLDEQSSGNNSDGEGSESLNESLSEMSSTNTELEIENAVKSAEDNGTDDDKPKKKKRSFMEILFGEPDEDDIETEEEIQAREAKKAEKKAKKEAAKAAKADKAEKAKAKKSLDDAKKKKDDAEKKRIKAEKKAKKKAEEAANAEPEKKLNKPMVIFIFSVFLGGVGFFYLSTVDFNYKLAIKQAADYFASQKYHKAYDEIKGVEVKEKDKELKERIYTVMYVERLYESYENNIQLGRQKKALDSLLRGVTKYYEYYDEAKELDIVSDLNYSFSQIQDALQNNYGITVEQAVAINELDDYEYMKTIEQYTEGMSE